MLSHSPRFLISKSCRQRVSKYQRILSEATGTVVSTVLCGRYHSYSLPDTFCVHVVHLTCRVPQSPCHILCSYSTPYLQFHKVPGTFCVHEIHLTCRDPQSPVHILFMQYSIPAGVPQSPGHILCSCGTPYL